MSIQEQIQQHKTYQQVLADSFGGCIYNVANLGIYDQEGVEQVLRLWDSMDANEKSISGGIMRGAIAFLRGE